MHGIQVELRAVDHSIDMIRLHASFLSLNAVNCKLPCRGKGHRDRVGWNNFV